MDYTNGQAAVAGMKLTPGASGTSFSAGKVNDSPTTPYPTVGTNR